jgi:hypothetical protein
MLLLHERRKGQLVLDVRAFAPSKHDIQKEVLDVFEVLHGDAIVCTRRLSKLSLFMLEHFVRLFMTRLYIPVN